MERNTVSKKSVNGGSQVSGGFIFDQMDRFAHDYIKKKFKVKNYLLTQRASVLFERQICDWNTVRIIVKHKELIKLFSNVYYAIIAVIDDYGKTYATAKFTFVEKDHAYCDTKGE